MSPALRAPALALLTVIILFASASAAHAESVQWNKAYPGDLFGRVGYGQYGGQIWMKSPNITVTYNTRIINDATGETIACGSSVPAGTKVRYEFVPHVSQDISWIATGYTVDSPYGEWGPSSVEPPLKCNPEDRYYTWFVANNAPAPGKGCNQCNAYIYGRLIVDPPSQVITGLQNTQCSPEGSDGSKVCTLQSLGITTATFNFGSTKGQFYVATGEDADKLYAIACFDMGDVIDPNHLSDNSSTGSPYNPPSFIAVVPAQAINCPITVTAPPNSPPAAPVVSGSCTIGQPSEMSFSSTDPESNQIRYGMDWDNDGTVDQWVPPTGYVDSGSHQSATRTYATEGSKTIQVLAEDQTGARSGWTRYTFSCAQSQCQDGQQLVNGQCTNQCTPNPSACSSNCGYGIDNCGYSCYAQTGCQDQQQQCPVGYQLVDGTCQAVTQCNAGEVLIDGICQPACAGGQILVNGTCQCPEGQTMQNGICQRAQECPIGWQLVNGTCTWTGQCPAGYSVQGQNCVITECSTPDYCSNDGNVWGGCTNALKQSCQYGCAAGTCNPVPALSVDFAVTPILVRTGHSVTVSWLARNATSCQITGGNGDSWSSLSNAGQTSSPINAQTIYTIQCSGKDGTTYQKAITVSIIPIESEPHN